MGWTLSICSSSSWLNPSLLFLADWPPCLHWPHTHLPRDITLSWPVSQWRDVRGQGRQGVMTPQISHCKTAARPSLWIKRATTASPGPESSMPPLPLLGWPGGERRAEFLQMTPPFLVNFLTSPAFLNYSILAAFWFLKDPHTDALES